MSLLDLGFTESAVNPSWKPDIDNISEQWKAGIRKQNRIGWNQHQRKVLQKK
jgi:hypothetical protein